MISAMAVQVDTRLGTALPTRRARSARAAAPGGLLALRSQGRAVENWLSTTASRRGPVRLGAHHGACSRRWARRWETSSGTRRARRPRGARCPGGAGG